MSNFDHILTGDGMSDMVPRAQSLRGEGPGKESRFPQFPTAAVDLLWTSTASIGRVLRQLGFR